MSDKCVKCGIGEMSGPRYRAGSYNQEEALVYVCDKCGYHYGRPTIDAMRHDEDALRYMCAECGYRCERPTVDQKRRYLLDKEIEAALQEMRYEVNCWAKWGRE